MRTKNSYYTNREEFSKFIEENDFEDEKNLLVQIFSSILEKNILVKIVQNIQSIVPKAKIIGTTTDGEILENSVTTDAIVVSVSAFEKATLCVAMQENSGDSFECGSQLAKKIIKQNTKVLLLFSDGLVTNGETFLNGVKSISKDVALAGGMAGDAALFNTTYIMSNEGILSEGAVGVSVNSDMLHVDTAYTFNWKEVGKELFITKVKDNRVYEIDSISAVAMYERYLGTEIANSLPAVGIEFPLIVTRDGIKIARAVLGKESDGSLVFAGNLAVGDSVHFGYGHSGMILKDSVDISSKFKHNIESIFVYSCMARRRFLDKSISAELTPLAEIAPTTGFFTYGEFFKAESCQLLNQTMTLITMSENSNNRDHEFKSNYSDVQVSDATLTQKGLSHLVEVTSRELRETNENLEKIVQNKTEELQAKIIELERASQVKSEFLAGMSHEIRTPLNAILGFVNILKKQETSPAKQEKFEIVEHSGETLLSIINDILDFSKIESGKMTLERRKFSIKQLFDETMELFYFQAQQKNIHSYVDFSSTMPKYFVGDIVRMKQVALNFMSNAIKFTPEGGTVSIKATYDDAKSELYFGVSDTGIGIEKENLNKIFQSFTQEDSTTTRKFGGTGLGLSISKALVEAMQGKVSVESVVGKGSTFSFILPLIKADTQEIIEDTPVEAVDYDTLLQGKVLLVEDNKTNQMLMNIILGDLELDVDLAENGLEAVSAFKTEKYDIILMDENMPKMSGIEATQIILDLEKEQNLVHTPIVALTANALVTDRARFLAAGMDEFITKPIDYEPFVSMLHKYLKPL